MQIQDFAGAAIELGDTVVWRGKRGLVRGKVTEVKVTLTNGRWNRVLHTWESGEFVQPRIYVKAEDRRYNGGYHRPMQPNRVVKIIPETQQTPIRVKPRPHTVMPF